MSFSGRDMIETKSFYFRSRGRRTVSFIDYSGVGLSRRSQSAATLPFRPMGLPERQPQAERRRVEPVLEPKLPQERAAGHWD